MKYKPVRALERAIIATDGPTIGSPYTMRPGTTTTFDLASGSIFVEFPASPEPNDAVVLKQRPGTAIATAAELRMVRNGHDFEVPELSDTDVLYSLDPPGDSLFLVGYGIGQRNKSYRWVFMEDGLTGIWVVDNSYSPTRVRVGGANCPVDTAFPGGIGATWEHLNIFTEAAYDAFGIAIDLTNSQFAFEEAGYYRISLAGAVEHNEVNAGREFYVRVRDTVSGAVSESFFFPTGRNSPGTPMSLSSIVFIRTEYLGNPWLWEIGNSLNTYTAVNFPILVYDINGL